MLLKPGDVIEREKPYAAVLDLKEKRKRCDYCFEEFKKLKRCSSCKIMWYCSQQCQRLDWKGGHKFTECQVYQICNANKLQEPKRKTFIDYDTPRLLLRLYLFTYYNPDRRYEERKTFEGKLRSLDWLMEHRADVIDHKDRMLIFEDIKLMFEESNLKYDEELLFRLFCKMYINGFSVMSQMLLEIGRAVFILASQFDHSCVPNAITQFYGKDIEVRAIQEIDTEKQEIFVSYLNVMEKIDKRQEILARGYYFKCQCERCVFELKHYSESESGKLKNDVVCKCSPAELIGGTKFVEEPIKVNEVKESNKKDTIAKKDANGQKSKKENTKPKDVGKQNVAKSKEKLKDIKQSEKKKSNDKGQMKDVEKNVECKKEEVKSEELPADWQQVKKTRNQKGKKSNSTTPEPPIVEQIKNDVPYAEQAKPPVETVQIVETKVEKDKPADEQQSDQSEDNLQDQASKLRPTTRSPHQTFKNRQNSKSPLPRHKLARSPLPGNRLRLSKSPLPKNRKEEKKTDENKSADDQNNKKNGDEVNIKKKVTLEPTRFVPYTDIERECLAKFDEMNKRFTEKVEKKSWPDAYELAKQLHRCYLTYYRDDFSSEITLHLIQMLQIKRNILREQFNLHNKEVNDLFSQLGKNILVTHGIGHHLYKTDYLDLCETIQSTTKLLESK